ncbi:Nickel uptake substrate-specific transmembrane region [Planctomycetes bacterium Pla163]|uniref:Nickel uptake substrate-specific transmembrane region n=1 Tax=Rohdeia mirabilis TaxID=2528008 RepID=A0A518CWD8_9BACT|nr:Nickel uptake substrate-specific transmembrane region [Planctomycetes bacterium Pla163]
MARNLTLLVVLVLGLVAAYLIVDPFAEPRRPAPGGLSENTITPRTADVEESEVVDAGDSHDAPAGSAAERREVGTSGGFTLRCIDASTGERVPGASVHTTTATPLSGPLHYTYPRPIDALIELGAEYRTDERGEVQLAHAHSGLRVAAVAGTLRGLGYVAPSSDDELVVVVELTAAQDLDVNVLDRLGSAIAGVEVTAIARGTREPIPLENNFDLLRGTTDDDGRVAFEWQALQGKLAPIESNDVWVQATVIGDAPVQASFDRDAPPDEPVTLTLPPTGSVVVDLVDKAGELVRGSHEMRISGSSPTTGRARGFTDGGRVRFSPVALSGDVRVDWGSGQRLIEGPVAPDQEIVVRLVEPHHQVVGRLVDSDGAAVADAEASIHRDATQTYPFRRGIRIRTDGDGRFGVIRNWHGDIVVPAMDEEWRILDGAPSSPSRREASVAVSFPDRGHEQMTQDLGDVVLAPIRPLVSGVVVAEDGRPIPDARIALAEQRDGERNATLAVVQTDDTGRFVIPTTVELEELASSGSLFLRASTGRASAREPVAFAPGDVVRLEVERRGAVAGRIVVEGRDDLSFMSVGLSTPGAPNAWRSGTGNPVGRDGSFRLDAAAGEYDLVVCGGGFFDDYMVACIEGVRVESGVMADDVRLDPLRIDLRQVSIEIEPADGTSLGRCEVFIGIDGRAAGTLDAGPGRLTLEVGEGRVDLWIVPEAYGPKSPAAVLVEDAGRISKVVIPPRPEVQIVYRSDGGSLPEGAALFAQLTRTLFDGSEPLDGYGPVGTTALPFESDAFELPAVGTWEAQLMVRGTRGRMPSPIGGVRHFEVESGVDGVQALMIDVTASELEEVAALVSGQ